jgi:predicted nucleic acid-binding protein
MTALFADTFYWIALVGFADTAHQRALALTSERADTPIVTTDEVLAEYLTFFSRLSQDHTKRCLKSYAAETAGVRVRM